MEVCLVYTLLADISAWRRTSLNSRVSLGTTLTYRPHIRAKELLLLTCADNEWQTFLQISGRFLSNTSPYSWNNYTRNTTTMFKHTTSPTCYTQK